MIEKRRKICIVVLLAATALYIVLVNVLVSAALVPSFMRKLTAFEKITEKSYSEQVQTTDIQDNHAVAVSEADGWIRNSEVNKWSIVSEDGYRLAAAQISSAKSAPQLTTDDLGSSGQAPESSHKWAVLLHGYTGWKEAMYPFAYMYARQGYNILAPDLRCQGESDGNFIGMGYTDKFDVLKWIDLILKVDPDAEIVIHGQSMGAACALMLSGMDELPSNVKAVISDSSYTDAYNMFRQDCRNWFHLPPFPLVDSANLALQIRGGYDLKKASALDAVKKSSVPTLFIHGDEDAMISVNMAHELYNAAACEKQLLIVEGAGHGQTQDKDPDKYWKTVFSFIAEHTGM